MDRRMQTDRREQGRGTGTELPVNATAAIQRLIQVSQKLVDLSERETQALLQRDMLSFAIIQDEKESITKQYTQASENFRSRLEDFRTVEKSLLNRLELLQKNLAEKAHGNNLMVAQMQQRAEAGTQKTLLMAQEFGQQKRVRLNDNNANKERGAE
jgi:hypothetical protein